MFIKWEQKNPLVSFAEICRKKVKICNKCDDVHPDDVLCLQTDNSIDLIQSHHFLKSVPEESLHQKEEIARAYTNNINTLNINNNITVVKRLEEDEKSNKVLYLRIFISIFILGFCLFICIQTLNDYSILKKVK